MIEMLDVKKQWGKIRAGFQGGPFFRSPAWNPNPKSFTDGPTAMTREVQQAQMAVKGNVFSGKTFSQKHG